MTVLKWIVIVLAVVYLGGVAVLYFKQRDMLFPIPPVGRTAPDAAGLPEAEEHVLTTADGEKVIVWHVPAKPGRPVVLFFPGNGDFLAGRVSRFEGITSDGTGLVALSYRGYAGSTGSPSEQGLLQDAAAAYAFTRARYDAEPDRGLGLLARHRRGRRGRLRASVGKLILEAPYTSTVDVAASLVSDRAGQPVDARSLSFRPAHRARSPCRCWSCMARPIPPSTSPSANACSRWPMSPSSSSAFPAAATKISTISARSKRLDNSSAV